MPITEEVLKKYVDGTSALLHQFGFHEAFALVIKELEVPVGIDEHELKSKVGSALSHMRIEQQRLRDPIQLVRAHPLGIIFTINKNTEVAFMPKGHRTVLQNVRWVGETPKPKEVEVDGRIMTTAYNRACKHFRELRKAQGLGRKRHV
ncbi:MAG TPA: hypothetical protein VJ579_00210 [Candidatus Paceibacterota bacterium]|nr:hypothetical protein [Candidatus Paceibacterota bacterium]